MIKGQLDSMRTLHFKIYWSFSNSLKFLVLVMTCLRSHKKSHDTWILTTSGFDNHIGFLKSSSYDSFEFTKSDLYAENWYQALTIKLSVPKHFL